MFDTNTFDETQYFTVSELKTLLADVSRKAKRSEYSKLDLCILALGVSAGLRAEEMALLKIGHVKVDESRRLYLPKTITKGKGTKWAKGREVYISVPQFRAIIATYKQQRLAAGATEDDSFLVIPGKATVRRFNGQIYITNPGSALTVRKIQKRFAKVVKCLPESRRLSIHKLRHSFCTYMQQRFEQKRVQQWMGHKSLATVGIYTHPLERVEGVDFDLLEVA
jgi:site-specific recombinase XerC